MKLVIGIVRPERANEVLEALYRANVRGVSMSRVQGHGGELDRVETYRGTTVKMGLSEKVRFEIAVSEEFVDPTVDALAEGARTGEVGDGKIFVLPLDRTVRIRTGETGRGRRHAGRAEARAADDRPRRGDRHRRHGLDARRDRAGRPDDAGARPLLRRPGAVEEHPEHVHDVRRRARGRGRIVGGDRLFVRVRGGQRDHRRLRPRLPERRRLRAARGPEHPAAALLRLPGQLLRDHRGAGLGRGRRAHAVRAVHGLHRALVGARLPGARPLGRSAAAGSPTSAPSTSPAACRSRWAPASRPSRRPWSIGARKDYGRQALLPHNAVYVLLGAGLLWFGWFGFNGGSGLSAGGSGVLAFTNTFLCPAATLVVWFTLDLLRGGKVTAIGAATAIIVGCVGDHAGRRIHQPRLGAGARRDRRGPELRVHRLAAPDPRRRDARRPRSARDGRRNRDPVHRRSSPSSPGTAPPTGCSTATPPSSAIRRSRCSPLPPMRSRSTFCS